MKGTIFRFPVYRTFKSRKQRQHKEKLKGIISLHVLLKPYGSYWQHFVTLPYMNVM